MADKPSASLWVELRGDIGRLEADMKKAIGVMQNTDRSVSSITKKIESSFSGIGGSVAKASVAITGINQALSLAGKGVEAFRAVVAKIG